MLQMLERTGARESPDPEVLAAVIRRLMAVDQSGEAQDPSGIRADIDWP